MTFQPPNKYLQNSTYPVENMCPVLICPVARDIWWGVPTSSLYPISKLCLPISPEFIKGDSQLDIVYCVTKTHALQPRQTERFCKLWWVYGDITPSKSQSICICTESVPKRNKHREVPTCPQDWSNRGREARAIETMALWEGCWSRHSSKMKPFSCLLFYIWFVTSS